MDLGRADDMEQAPGTLVPLEAVNRGHLGGGDLAQQQQGLRWPHYPQHVMADALAVMDVARAPGHPRRCHRGLRPDAHPDRQLNCEDGACRCGVEVASSLKHILHHNVKPGSHGRGTVTVVAQSR